MTYKALVCGLGMLAFVGGSGCTMEAGEGGGTPETVGEVQNAFSAAPSCDASLYAHCWDQSDPTGAIQVRIYECKSAFVGHAGARVCLVESDRVLVGGGGTVDGGDPNIGALLTQSFPVSGSLGGAAGGGWAVSSKDHIYSNPHNLKAYAIGLKLKDSNGVPYLASRLAPFVHVTTANSSASGNLAAAAAVAVTPLVSGASTREVMLGGGASPTSGQLLTAVLPTAAGWVAKSKDHLASSPGTITAYTISMSPCPTGLGYCLAQDITIVSGASASGYHNQNAFVSTPGNAVMIAVGGSANYNGSGRMLVALIPQPVGNGAASMLSKDHGVADTGSDSAAFVTLRRTPL